MMHPIEIVFWLIITYIGFYFVFTIVHGIFLAIGMFASWIAEKVSGLWT